MMLLSDWFLARQEKRIQAAREEGYAEGYAKGREEGRMAAWNERRRHAESRGEPFTEPLPGPPER